jgi:hypothetical protein
MATTIVAPADNPFMMQPFVTAGSGTEGTSRTRLGISITKDTTGWAEQ